MLWLNATAFLALHMSAAPNHSMTSAPPPPPPASGINTMHVMGGAALAGGAVVGAAVGSVTLAVAGAGAAAYAATRDDRVGDAAKATGTATVTAMSRAKEFDEKHKVTATAGSWLQQGLNSAREFNDKHNVTGRIAAGVEDGMNRATKALNGDSAVPPQPSPTPQVAQPHDLPPGWQAVATPDGRVYYWKQSTGETTWEKPTK
mmetsp:Transcript_24087/g.61384  ORF Transcript_24087/g.61384 Transcript_24087/m.61384 type:complete len:203 (+) Transcript_24087:1-609(+)